jgi:hypothetical protein
MWDFVLIWVRESVGLTIMELDSRGISSETGVGLEMRLRVSLILLGSLVLMKWRTCEFCRRLTCLAVRAIVKPL